MSVEAIDPWGKFLGWQTASASRLGSALAGLRGGVLWLCSGGGLARSVFNGELLIEGGLPKGSAPSTVRKVWSGGRRCRRREALVIVSSSKGSVSGPAIDGVLRRCRYVTDNAGDGLAARPR